jgi:hypothetical protein
MFRGRISSSPFLKQTNISIAITQPILIEKRKKIEKEVLYDDQWEPGANKK